MYITVNAKPTKGTLYARVNVLRDRLTFNDTSGVIGRYTGMNIGTEYTKSRRYDTYGRLSTITAGSDVFTYSYLTNSNLIQSVSVSASSVPVCVTTNTHEANRNLTTQVKNEELIVTSSIISQYD